MSGSKRRRLNGKTKWWRQTKRNAKSKQHKTSIALAQLRSGELLIQLLAHEHDSHNAQLTKLANSGDSCIYRPRSLPPIPLSIATQVYSLLRTGMPLFSSTDSHADKRKEKHERTPAFHSLRTPDSFRIAFLPTLPRSQTTPRPSPNYKSIAPVR